MKNALAVILTLASLAFLAGCPDSSSPKPGSTPAATSATPAAPAASGAASASKGGTGW